MTTTITLAHSSHNLSLSLKYDGTVAEVAAFVQRFVEFTSSVAPDDPESHWSRMTREERTTARQGETRSEYGGTFHSGKIPAIKLVRARMGIGLRDAKDLVEAYLDGVAAGKTL